MKNILLIRCKMQSHWKVNINWLGIASGL